MRKIADATELEQELRRLLAYSQSSLPSRTRIASELKHLSERVAEFGKSKEEWIDWLDKGVSEPSVNLLGMLSHFVNGDAKHVFPPNVMRQAEKAYRAAKQLDTDIAYVFREMGS